MYLTKSDFKAAQQCATRLYYRKTGGPRPPDDGSGFLQLLADGGSMIEEIARRHHPGGRAIGFRGTPEDCARRTLEALRADEATLFEATLIAGGALARVDVLVKRGARIELHEVKSTSFDGAEHASLLAEGKPGVFRGRRAPHGVLADWRHYLEDVAFQCWVAGRALPGMEIEPFLVMPDTSRSTRIDGLWSWFRLERAEDGRTAVRFAGDAARLAEERFLATVSVAEEVRLLGDEVRDRALVYVGSLHPHPVRIDVPPSTHCRDCELHEVDADGETMLFAECWGELGRVRPRVFDLYRVPKPLADEMIGAGRIGLLDVDEARLVNAKGERGAVAERQLVQLRNTRLDRQWVSPELPAILDGFAHPLHFFDFETAAPVIPYHAGMRPYENVAFQWSCHTVAAPGEPAEHGEWINTEAAFPGRSFAASLRERIGDGGTVFMWTAYERTILRQVARQLEERGEEDGDLLGWLRRTADRLEDMNALALAHYFHPRMRGSTSLKVVAEAVWHSSPAVREAFAEYAAAGEDRGPYAALPPMRVAGEEVVVREGTAAIRAYQAMMYGAQREDPAARAALRDLLLRYCRLDTAAMVMVWMHWRGGRT